MERDHSELNYGISRLVLGIVLAAASPATALEHRTLTQAFPLSYGETLRLANLSGVVELVPSSGSEVEVVAEIYAEGRDATETARLLKGMFWVRSKDVEGRSEWALSYPVADFRSFHYPGTGDRKRDPETWNRLDSNQATPHTRTTFYGRPVAISGSPGPATPTLFADLKIALPSRSSLVVRNAVGKVAGDDGLNGDLEVRTVSCSVFISSFSGRLVIDVDSGNVTLGNVRGKTEVKTGAGRIRVEELAGDATLRSGYGSITVPSVKAGTLDVATDSGTIRVESGKAKTLIADSGTSNIYVIGVEMEVFVGDSDSGKVVLKDSPVIGRPQG